MLNINIFKAIIKLRVFNQNYNILIIIKDNDNENYYVGKNLLNDCQDSARQSSYLNSRFQNRNNQDFYTLDFIILIIS